MSTNTQSKAIRKQSSPVKRTLGVIVLSLVFPALFLVSYLRLVG